MKKTLALIISITLISSVAVGCTKKENPKNESSSSSSSSESSSSLSSSSEVSNQDLKTKGEVPTVTLGDVEIILGKTTVKDLTDKGFTLDWGIYEPLTSIEAGQYFLNSLTIKKDNKTYAYISIANLSDSTQNVENTIVYLADIKFDSDLYYTNGVLNGIAKKGSTIDDVKKAMGIEPASENIKENDTSYIIYKEQDSKFTYKFSFDKDKNLKSVEIKFDPNKI